PLLTENSLATMTKARTVPGGLRAYGWDVDTRFSSNRGTIFLAGTGFGHTGFTGTSIWVDPASETAVIFLSNRVHPQAKQSINRLRGEVATLAAQACKVEDANRARQSVLREPDLADSGVRPTIRLCPRRRRGISPR